MSRRDNRSYTQKSEDSDTKITTVEVEEELTLEEDQIEEKPVVVEPAPEPQKKDTSTMEQPNKTTNSTVSKLDLELSIYQTKMLGNPGMKETGILQYGLYNVMRGILKIAEPNEARRQWNSLLSFVNKNSNEKGVFTEFHVFRGGESWPGSPVEFTSFRRLIWLVLQTANPKTRKDNLTHIRGDLVHEGLLPGEVETLVNFYN